MSRIIDEDCQNILKTAPCDWNKLRGRRIFLTGGTGFFGKWLLHSFLFVNRTLELGATIVVLSRSPEKFLTVYPIFANHDELTFITGDVRDFMSPAGSFDILIHAATPASAKLETEAPDEMYSIVVDGTERVLDFAKNTGVQKILLTSSGAVYGPQPSGLEFIDETFQPMPVTAYGKGKYKAEKLCVASNINTVIARCFAFVGPYLPMDIHYAAGNFIRDVLKGDSIVIKGDGRPFRSYLYAADLMNWLWTILLEGKTGEVYNTGSQQPVSISELARTVADCLDNKVEVQIQSKANLSVPAPRYVPCTAKASSELRLSQHYPLADAIRRTAAWARETE